MFFMPKVIEMLSQGDFFKTVCSIALKVIAWLAGIMGVLFWFSLWMLIGNLTGFQVVALLLHQCIFVVFIYTIIHTLLIRSKEIQQLPESDFTIIPIIARILRLLGDLSALEFAYLGSVIFLMGMAGQSFLNRSPYGQGFQQGGNAGSTGNISFLSFFSGFGVLACFLMAGFLSLLFFYLWSEWTIVLADMAINIKRVRTKIEEQPVLLKPSSASGSAGLMPEPEPIVVEPPKCPQCSIIISEKTKFCGNCGYKVK